MSKIVYIGEQNGKCYLEICNKDGNHLTSRKRTNQEENIKAYLTQEGCKFIDADMRGNDLILYTANHVSFVVKEFQTLYHQPLLQDFFKGVVNAPVVSKNLSKGVRSNIPQLLGLKLMYANHKKLAALAMTGTLLIVGSNVFSGGSIHLHQMDLEERVVSEMPKQTISHEIDFSNDLEKILGVSIEERLEQTASIQSQYGSYDRSKLMLGSRINIERAKEILETEEGKFIIKTAHTYGVDPYLLIAKACTESSFDHASHIPGGKGYNGAGVGMFQLEKPDGRMIRAWNYETESEDTLSITMENATDFEKNTKAAAMYLQNRINLYDGNIFLALQSYNYGAPMMSVVIHDYAQKMGITEEEVKHNLNDLGWLTIVEDIYNNPNDYLYRAAIGAGVTDVERLNWAKQQYVWAGEHYGNPYYVYDLLSYYIGVKTENRNLDGTVTVVDLVNQEAIKLESNTYATNKIR